MWIYTPKGAYSIVELQDNDVPHDQDGSSILMCRARRSEHLEALGYTQMQIVNTPSNDYPFRVFASRTEISDRIRSVVFGINYGNFKDAAEKEGIPRGMLWDIWNATAESLDSRSPHNYYGDPTNE